MFLRRIIITIIIISIIVLLNATWSVGNRQFWIHLNV